MSTGPPGAAASILERISRKRRALRLAALLLATLAVVAPVGLLVLEPLAVPVALGVVEHADATSNEDVG